jgi:hypothetical protein
MDRKKSGILKKYKQHWHAEGLSLFCTALIYENNEYKFEDFKMRLCNYIFYLIIQCLT